MKLKLIELPSITETDIELPAYFYTQGDEAFEEDYIKIDKNGKTTVKRSHYKLIIEYFANDFTIQSHYIKRNEISKEEYEQAFNFAIKQFKK